MAMLVEYNGIKPVVEKDAFIAPNATIIGDVTIKKGASVWYGVVIRGDMESVVIGEKSNIQDNCTIHTDEGFPALIGDRVSVGHNAVIHGCEISDDCLIAIGSIILSGARIHESAVVAAGSVVREGQVVQPFHLVAGAPAETKRILTREEAGRFAGTVGNYLKLSKAHKGNHTLKSYQE